jgi:hypothetical protein
LPELSTQKKVTSIFHVDDKTDKDQAQFDMIIGMDLLTNIGLYINTEAKTVCWEGSEIPLKERGDLSDKDVVNVIYAMAVSPDILQEAEARQERILDADYSKVDIDEHISLLSHLTKEQKDILTKTLKKLSCYFRSGIPFSGHRKVKMTPFGGKRAFRAGKDPAFKRSARLPIFRFSPESCSS